MFKKVNLLFFSLLSIISYPSFSMTCNGVLSEDVNDFDLVESAETKIINSYNQKLEVEALTAITHLHGQVSELINSVLGNESLGEDIRNGLRMLVYSVDFLNDPVDTWRNILTVQEGSPYILHELVQVNSFDQIIPNKSYSVSSNDNREFTISFNEQFLSNITSNKIPDTYKKAFIRAIKKGIVTANGQIGIKLMKTYEGIFFAEVKLIGRLGDKRIYGLVKNSHVTFGFVGSDSESGTDTMHRRIRAISN